MGIDGNVRDQFSRLLYGARLSLMVGFSTVTFAIIIGTVLGAMSGYFGGWVDNVIMRTMDVLLAFPSLLLAIAIVTVLGPGLINALLAIGIVSIPAYARVVRASVLSVREMDYVSATRALGGNSFQILFLRIMPNALTPLIVQGTLGIATAILGCCRPVFPGTWRPATHSGMGLHAGLRTQPGFHSAASGFLPRPGNYADCIGLQLAG